MSFVQTTRIVRETLGSTFEHLDAWFDEDEALRCFQPEGGSWRIDQILEHVSLTNHFLLLTLRKHTATAERRAFRGDPIPTGESDLERLDVIGERGSFTWPRPDHMEPTGTPSSNEVRTILNSQFQECLTILDRLAGGIGAMQQITMTVNGLGRIDLYQWMYFLAQHARRHLQQMANIRDEYIRREPTRNSYVDALDYQ